MGLSPPSTPSGLIASWATMRCSWRSIRLALIIDAFDRVIVAWTTFANANISGSDVRDMMMEAVEKRLGAIHAPHAIEHLSDDRSAYTARYKKLLAQALGFAPCITSVARPQSNGISEAFVKKL